MNNVEVENSSQWSGDSNTSPDSASQSGSETTAEHKWAKCILVTGGAGFIGSHVALRLLERGDRVVVVDEMNDYYDLEQKRANVALLQAKAAELDKCCPEDSAAAESCFAFYEQDICETERMAEIFAAHGITHVCHLAARAGVRPSIENPFIYVKSNVVGTVGLMELAAQHGVANFVYASSSSVYGGSTKDKFSEEDVVDQPVSQYAATKKACELFAATYHSLYGLNCTGLRFFTVYGPRGRPDMAPFKFIDRVVRGTPIDQYGDGTSERDYTYIDDIACGVLLAVDKPLGNEVINLGRGSPVSLSDFIRTVEEACGRKAIINRMPMQPGDVMRTSCDDSKAFKLLGYKAHVPLAQGIRETVQWYQEWTQYC